VGQDCRWNTQLNEKKWHRFWVTSICIKTLPTTLVLSLDSWPHVSTLSSDGSHLEPGILVIYYQQGMPHLKIKIIKYLEAVQDMWNLSLGRQLRMTLSWTGLGNLSFTPWRLWESLPLIIADTEYYSPFQGQRATNWLPTEQLSWLSWSPSSFPPLTLFAVTTSSQLSLL
jgi:hypothetical protein